MKVQTSQILLNNLQFYAYHGVGEQETIVGNTYAIDLKMDVDFSKAALSDDVQETVSYADVYESIKTEMAIPSKLIEHVIYRIGTRLLKDFELIQKIDITLSKTNPPMGADIDTAAVRIICSR
ncbi:dihydroneopterin aldolase [Bacteroides coprosuis DSM 18011]|uniref:7,8-dihydroneopterin aldolase n=1 Tax=Bacteroides coprosuis DSM 18011 TaxID=679937 RepID=F3ZNN5_9BACE|nr:dihydroneopterin aldolase [Bacteroides coprosuis]EGJ70224.1 dihydroneopterin aldolase [Bacteroides coprosuis DSM 18011]